MNVLTEGGHVREVSTMNVLTEDGRVREAVLWM